MSPSLRSSVLSSTVFMLIVGLPLSLIFAADYTLPGSSAVDASDGTRFYNSGSASYFLPYSSPGEMSSLKNAVNAGDLPSVTICAAKPSNSSWTTACSWGCDSGHIEISGACLAMCGPGQYRSGGVCINVGIAHYSPATDEIRYTCQSNRTTTGSGTGADAQADCL
ncbi:hypothetical protein OAQ84_01750, partial [Bdellovibrionales bacterium]|nr:hypothetical protein [Bdellovibrionales bacterium]